MSHTAIDLPAVGFGPDPGLAAAGARSPSAAQGVLYRIVVTLQAWRQRAAERRHLAAMDDRMRKDVGLSGVDVWREVNKPAWRA